MAVFDLRTLYSGGLKAAKKHIQEANDISEKIAEEILETLQAVGRDAMQMDVREKLSDLSQYEAQLADLVVRGDGVMDSTVHQKMAKTLDNLRRTIQRLERILSSYMNEANNS